MAIKTDVISRLYTVASATWAARPTTGLKSGDIFYCTDRRVLYRWSGSAWVAITIYSFAGLHAAIPSAADLPEGSLYYETDTTLLFQVQSAAWVAITNINLIYTEIEPPAASVGSAAWADWDLSAVIPAGAVYAEIMIYNPTGGALNSGVRKKGSSLNRYMSLAATHGHTFMTVALDSSRVCQRYGNNVEFVPVGYWS